MPPIPTKNTRLVKLLGAAMGWGSRRVGCAGGPLTLYNGSLIQNLQQAGIPAAWEAMLHTDSPAPEGQKSPQQALPHVTEFCTRLATHTANLTRHNHLPVILGGDHSTAIGTWSGITKELGAQQNFGLIWIDAHLDAHTPATRNEGRWGGHYHGQPLALLMGEGETELTSLAAPANTPITTPALNPNHVTLIGIRSFEPGEQKFLESRGVRIFYMEEVKEKGFAHAWEVALNRAQNGTKGFGVSLDLDAICPKEACAVGTPEPNGIAAADILHAFRQLQTLPTWKGLEITEFNPSRDKNRKTETLIANILLAALKTP